LLKIKPGSSWFNSLYEIQQRTLTFLLAALVLTFLVPISPAYANGEPTPPIAIQGVTPPVAGATPVETTTATSYYTGTVTWSDINGELSDGEKFQSNVIYGAYIVLSAISPYTFNDLDPDSFTVEGASTVLNDSIGIGENAAWVGINAIFIPLPVDATEYLDTSFPNGGPSSNEGAIKIKDIFGESPLNDSNTAVGSLKVDRIAVDSQNRIVALASFYNQSNWFTSVPGSVGTAIGSGYKNSINIAAQVGNTDWSSAAVAAREYTSTVDATTYDDWYLPSKDELNALYEVYDVNESVAGLAPVMYWSSSQATASQVWSQAFDDIGEIIDGQQLQRDKSDNLAVRPIRAGWMEDPILASAGPGTGTIFYVTQTDFACGPDLFDLCNYLEAAPSGWSGPEVDTSFSWARDYLIDNHILFRLNANGSYDHSFGAQGPSLRKDENDTPKPYVLVTTTCSGYTERLDLEIDSQGKILVLLSGQAEGDTCSDSHHNFVVRYTSSGAIDPNFGTNGAIGTLTPQYGEASFLFADLALDNAGHILVASLHWIDFAEDEDLFRKIEVGRYLPTGLLDTSFGTLVAGTQRSGVSELEVFFPNGEVPQWGLHRNVLMIPDNANPDGYVVAFTGATLPTMDSEAFDFQYTQLIRLDQNGAVVPLANPVIGIDPEESLEGQYVIPNFFLSDIVPDGPTGFIISGTYFLDELEQGAIFSLMFRIRIDGTFDTNFGGLGGDDELLSPIISRPCFNTALLRNYVSHQSSSGVVLGNLCEADSSFRLKAFSSSGQFQGEFSVEDPTDRYLEVGIINQLIKTSDGKVLALSGNRPTNGFFGFIFTVSEPEDYDWTDVVISRYTLPGLFTAPSNPRPTITGPARITGTVGTAITPVDLTLAGGTGAETATVTAGFALPAGLTLSTAGRISGTPTAAGTTTTSFTVTDSLNETATATVEFVISLAPTTPPAPTPPVVVYVAPTPVPYLKTLTTPELNLKDGKLICTPGTYNAGYTLNGVIQGNATALFTPSSFRYNLLINGVAQTSLAVTSSSTSQSWNMPTGSTGALVTCSVTVTANGITNTDKSGDNTSGASSALTTQSAAIATANATYAAALAANTKAYQKAIVDNRTQWRSTTEKIRTDYYAERDRIRSLPSTKATRALSSAALKAYTAALKKSAADYKASGPAALAAKDAADKAALDAKTAAIAKANAAYGTAIESIGYGVLIP
jgi:hypothetical protein